MTDVATTGWGLIAGNGRFPFLVLEGARSQGIDMAVIALKEEASQELANSAKRRHGVSLGELSKAIDLMHSEGVTQAVMAGQVKHNKIFSTIRPDWKLATLAPSDVVRMTALSPEKRPVLGMVDGKPIGKIRWMEIKVDPDKRVCLLFLPNSNLHRKRLKAQFPRS